MSDFEATVVGAEPEYPSLSDEKIKELALGCINGQVFGSWMLPEYDQRLFGSIFMVSMFLDDIALKRMKRDNIVHMYEWRDKAGSMGINGYPMFMSVNLLDANDSERLGKKIEQIKSALNEL